MAPTATQLTARDLLSGRPARLHPSDSVEKAIDVLTRRGVSNLPVVDGQLLVGIISEWDCLRVMGLDGHANLFEHPVPPVGAWMATEIRVVAAGADLDTLAQVFVAEQFHRVPVVEEDGGLVGMLGRHDVLVALRRARKERHKRDLYPDYRRPQ